MDSWRRRFLVSCLVAAPGVAVVAGVALWSYGDPKGIRPAGLALLLAGLFYLLFAVHLRARPGQVARLALVGWSAGLCGGLVAVSLPVVFPRQPDWRTEADSLADADWVAQCFEEFAASYRAAWEPYVYWRRLPFDGKYIGIAADGTRRTWNAPPDGRDRTVVLMFGGSTMWGSYVPDDDTIPSLVSRRLHERGLAAEVVNRGESGYVSTQSLIALMLELRRGRVPDVVVFYDGVNDVAAAYYAGEGGIPQNEVRRVAEFERTTGVRDTRTRERKEGAALGREVVDRYLGNLSVLAALAARFGFRYRCYWQPCVYVEKPTTAYEKEAAGRLEPDMRAFFRENYVRIREREPPPFFRDLSGLFAEESAPRYVDWCHLSPAGNAAVADAMLEDLVPILR